MLYPTTLQAAEGLRAKINQAYRMPESQALEVLLEAAHLDSQSLLSLRNLAMQLVERVRSERKKSTGIDSFLNEYSLSSQEGIALMCLAEALLRVPDAATVDRLIKDKLAAADWKSHKGQSDSFFVNATTWALMLTGKVLSLDQAESALNNSLKKWVNRSGEAVVRKAVDTAMRIMSKQFVMGRTIVEAMDRAKKKEAIGYRYSYDMLGEAAITTADAERYFQAYSEAIESIGSRARASDGIYKNPGISIKLSALHPRYQEAHYESVMQNLQPKLLKLAQLAKQYSIAMTIDAEESERLELSMDLIESVFKDKSLDNWNGFGLALQSYQKRAFYLIDWLAELAASANKRIMVRLIKGAYWDSEIKKAQMQGQAEYPVFTRKVFTDVSFQACAKKILSMTDRIYPQFATHNAYSVALILNLVGEYRDFEFQCLHGMGNELYEQIVPAQQMGIPCRIYAPVGSHEDLLPYLVRRLLENGANSSFVNRIVDESAPITSLIEDPVSKARSYLSKLNQNIPLPKDIFQPERPNSQGLDFTDRAVIVELQTRLSASHQQSFSATPLVAGKHYTQDKAKAVFSPQNRDHQLGQVLEADLEDVQAALQAAKQAFPPFAKTPVQERAKYLRRFAELLESHKIELMRLLCLEAGKTWNDALAEHREAVDFCYYYASQAEALMAKPLELKGYTGETNTLSLQPRGTVLCISPWNFPLAIFIGQVTAALATGNTVIAKPAEQTALVAYQAVKLMQQAGIPEAVVQLLPGPGETVGAALVADPAIKAVIFTGSTQTAMLINKSLAARSGEIVPLIAETGGQNAMIVDSSALLEQVVMDVINSAFGSAGQRCSALRVLYAQEEIMPRLLALLKGAMAELQLADPAWLATDIGPVIDQEALSNLQEHAKRMKAEAELIYEVPLPEHLSKGYFMPPMAFKIDSIQQLKKEVFGPVLHVISYQQDKLDTVLDAINSTEFGLTFGVHSRINERVNYIVERIHAGNCYVNRNTIGAVVGLQPFGGQGLSGTGPKAGGPHYLLRLCHEKTISIDTTAAGGNASLMSLPD